MTAVIISFVEWKQRRDTERAAASTIASSKFYEHGGPQRYRWRGNFYARDEDGLFRRVTDGRYGNFQPN